MNGCLVHGKRWCWKCAIFTLGFPVEHMLWEKAPIFRSVTAMLGL